MSSAPWQNMQTKADHFLVRVMVFGCVFVSELWVEYSDSEFCQLKGGNLKTCHQLSSRIRILVACSLSISQQMAAQSYSPETGLSALQRSVLSLD